VVIENSIGGVKRGGDHFLEVAEGRDGRTGNVIIRDVVESEGVLKVERRGSFITDKESKEAIDGGGRVGKTDVREGEVGGDKVAHGRARKWRGGQCSRG